METIGKYQIQRVLGHGAMGTVYEALDPGIERKVALKTMIPGLAETPDLKLRFLREAQAAGRLRHRNIVTVYDLGEDKGRPYIAMEYIEGTDLEKIIQNREPLSMEWKLDVIRQVCDGLCYAHKNGIVHRDIKPANIRVTPEGEVKIMDFGIAHLQSSNLTKSGIVMGTVHYMAPEQIEGHKVDHRADIFSVGTIAYELIAYRKAFDGESITAVMYRIIHENPDPKELPKSEYSPALEGVVMKALSKSTEERYQSLDELLLDLGGLLRETAPRLAGRQANPVDREADTQALAIDLDKEQQRRRGLVETWIREATLAMEHGDARKALELARQAQTFLPEDPAVRKLLVDVESEALRQRVEQEMAEMRVEVEEARAAGQLQRALTLCRRLLDINPEDEDVTRWTGEIEVEIREKEVEELCSQALAYATEGETELALKIAGRVEKFAPESARYLELKRYLGEEANKKKAGALIATAQEHLAQGRLAEARATAEQALAVLPTDTVAREIRDRVANVLAMRDKSQRAVAPTPPPRPAVAKVASAEPTPPAGLAAARAARPAPQPPKASPAPGPAPPPPPVAGPLPSASAAPPIAPRKAVERPSVPRVPSPAPQAASAASSKPNSAPKAASPAPQPPGLTGAVPMTATSPEPTSLTPIPEGNPSNPEATALLDAARRHLRERKPQEALPLLERAAELEAGHAGIQRILKLTRLEARKDEAEALTSSALEFFMKNKYAKAKQAAEKALGLEPGNKKAKELMNLLAALG